MTLRAGTKLGRYEIRSKLGEGGMGEVYLAQDTSELGRTVVLKILPADVAKDKDRLQRFTQEARTVSNLNHPNILTVYEFGQTDSASFIATEYVEGVTLREHLSNRRLKLIDILDVAIQIVAALNAAHEAGVTHRDLKPENVMVRKDHIVKVLDFGLAKLSQPRAAAGGSKSDASEDVATKVLVKTEPGLVMGTVSYMSPEQSGGTGVDQRTDIWSAGVVIYEMIAGCVPFQGKDIHRQIIAIQEQDPAPLSQQVEGVPDRLEEIVAKCLAKDKNERYQTAKDLLIDLRNLRRKLDVDAEIERTVAPQLRSTSGDASRSTQSASMNAGATLSAGPVHTASSAEYVGTRIKQHKLVALVALLALVAGVTGIGLYLRARNSTGAIKSIAVMPFVNESGNADAEYLSDGMTETLITSLSQVPDLNVKARSSVFRYKGKETDPKTIGKELNVQAILNGRVAQHGDQLTLNLELVDVQNENVIWSEQYNRKQTDLVSLQSDIARDVSRKLKTKLSGADTQRLTKTYTANPEAYQLYLKGRFYWNKRTGESLKKSVEYFNQAIEKDPNYAMAFAGMADAYNLMPGYSAGSAKEYLPKARTAAMKALEIDDNLAEAHASLANVLGGYDWNFAESTREFQRAIELNPNYPTAHHWYGENLGQMGRFDEGIAELKRAQELDPLSLIINADLGEVYTWARQYDKAIEQLRKTIEMDQSFYYAHWHLGLAYALKGSIQEGIAEYQKARSLDDDPWVLALLGHAYAASGKRDEALKTLDQLKETSKQRYVRQYIFAVVYAGLNEKDQAFQWLEKGYQGRADDLTLIKVDPLLDNLRSDPRFADLVRRVGLPQ